MNEMLDFVKALSDPKRLRIIGLLSQGSVSRAEITRKLKLSTKEIVNHLAYLEQVEVISQSNDIYTLNNDRLATLGRDKLSEARPFYIPANELDEKSKKILKVYLNPDGSIKQIPTPPKLQILLKYLVQFFELDKNYTEKEINTILRRFNEDTAGLRRDLVDAKLLARESDGSRYWRID